MLSYSKKRIQHPSLYVSCFEKSADLPYVVFVHGGPGLNCGTLEYLIEHEGIFDSLRCNIVLYDQRGCGRSATVSDSVSHQDNLDDLAQVCRAVQASTGVSVAALIGHSYGAKVVFDYIRGSDSKVLSVLLAIAPSMLTPRLTNLLLDLSYLKQVDRAQYESVLDGIEDLNPETLWQLTEVLAPVFYKNEARGNVYWANLAWKDKVGEIGHKLALPISESVFTSVRKDLYSKEQGSRIAVVQKPGVGTLWINGLHDLIMGSPSELWQNKDITWFLKSAHYPHIEESARFCDELNAFLEQSCA